jgi:hypothetical protein
MYAGEIGRWQTVLALPFLSGTTSNKNEQKKKRKCVYIYQMSFFFSTTAFILKTSHT